MQSHYVYILRCADGTLYTGYTTDLKRRTAEHNDSSSVTRYTRSRQPVKLVYSESYDSRATAMQREYEIKQLTRAQKQALVDKT